MGEKRMKRGQFLNKIVDFELAGGFWICRWILTVLFFKIPRLKSALPVDFFQNPPARIHRQAQNPPDFRKNPLMCLLSKIHPPVLLCNEKEFSSQEHLDRHVETVLVKSAKHICPICEEHFSREDSLTRHINDIHKAQKDFKCPEYPLTFARRDTLNKHVSRAAGHPEKHGISFHCHDCGEDILFSSLAANKLKCKKGQPCDCQSSQKQGN